jgi:quercetin dioxygenase-like cupin family protein
MTRDDFLAMVAAGSAELVIVTRPADGTLDGHSHPFAANALVLRGELTIVIDGAGQLYRAGDVFSIPAGCAHAERFGPAGVSYLAARSVENAT